MSLSFFCDTPKDSLAQLACPVGDYNLWIIAHTAVCILGILTIALIRYRDRNVPHQYFRI